MRTLKQLLLACLVAFAVARNTSAQTTATNSALILYDSTGQFGFLGGLYSTMLANLLGHFDMPYQIEPVESYTAGQMNKVKTTFYFGSVYDNPAPAAFTTEALTTTNTLCWFKYNLWHVAGTNFNAKFGFQFGLLDWSGYSNIVYKGQSLLKNQLDPELGTVSVLNTNIATVLATANKADGTFIPYATHASNLWYFADVPFDYISEEDRYLAFCDLLHDVLKVNHATNHSALIRLEDVAPTMYDPVVLKQTADVMRAQNVPFAVALVPWYRDPLGSYNGGVPEEHHMSDAADTNSVAFVGAINYMLTNRGQLIIHGYSHQYSNVFNPYTGTSGDDFEFWRENFVSNDTANPAALNLYQPIAEDSVSNTLFRINAAKAELAAVGMKEVGWEFPHYAASAIDSLVIGSNFPLVMNRVLYFDNTGHIAGQFFPYPVKKDIYGQRIMPENIGNYEPLPFGVYPTRSVADLVRAAQKNLVVRDGWAAGYFHPFYDLTNLAGMITGIKALGYTYVSVSSDPPAITKQPSNTSALAGGTATFTVVATGAPVLAYQWYFNNSNKVGTSSASLAIAGVSSNNVGAYKVVITNGFGAITSSVANLTLGSLLVITNQPKGATVTIGTNYTLSVGVSGSSPTYHWQLEGKNIGGGGQATFVLQNIQIGDIGNYRVVVSNAFSVVTSAVAVITVASPPVFSAQPASSTNAAGGSVTLSWWADGAAPVTYLVKFKGNTIATTTNSWYDLDGLTTNNAGVYSIVATNAFGSSTSSNATITVIAPPTITTQPKAQTVTKGSPVTFSVVATGTPPLTYQWKFNTVNIVGATSASYSIAAVTTNSAGNYRVAVSSQGVSVNSTQVKLTVN